MLFILNPSFMKNSETVPLHFILELEGLLTLKETFLEMLRKECWNG
jgi:hypothetical protein